jgi:hypothetical protein
LDLGKGNLNTRSTYLKQAFKTPIYHWLKSKRSSTRSTTLKPWQMPNKFGNRNSHLQPQTCSHAQYYKNYNLLFLSLTWFFFQFFNCVHGIPQRVGRKWNSIFSNKRIPMRAGMNSIFPLNLLILSLFTIFLLFTNFWNKRVQNRNLWLTYDAKAKLGMGGIFP